MADRGEQVEDILASVGILDWEYLLSEIPMSGRGRFWHGRINDLRRWYADRDRDAQDARLRAVEKQHQ